MKILIFSIGQNKTAQVLSLEQEYIKRLSRFVKFEIKEFKDSKKLLDSLDKQYIIGLEERGEKFDSNKFAKWIEAKMPQGQDLVFIIADEAGFEEEVKNKFDFVLSLSALTFPHEIARMLLCEQIYRAFTILNNHPYHK